MTTPEENLNYQSPFAYIRYRNHRGREAWRKVRPTAIWHGKTEWHPKEQWFMRALDLDKNEWRDFAMRDIIEWRTDGRVVAAGEEAQA